MAKKAAAKKTVKKTRTVTQIKNEIKKLKEELKESLGLKPTTITLEVTIKPEYMEYDGNYGGRIEKIVCKKYPEFANQVFDNYGDELCRNGVVSIFGEESIAEAERIYENENHGEDEV